MRLTDCFYLYKKRAGLSRKKGHHHTEEGNSLIARIAGQMNNKRLFTFVAPKVDRVLLLQDIANLLL